MTHLQVHGSRVVVHIAAHWQWQRSFLWTQMTLREMQHSNQSPRTHAWGIGGNCMKISDKILVTEELLQSSTWQINAIRISLTGLWPARFGSAQWTYAQLCKINPKCNQYHIALTYTCVVGLAPSWWAYSCQWATGCIMTLQYRGIWWLGNFFTLEYGQGDKCITA